VDKQTYNINFIEKKEHSLVIKSTFWCGNIHILKNPQVYLFQVTHFRERKKKYASSIIISSVLSEYWLLCPSSQHVIQGCAKCILQMMYYLNLHQALCAWLHFLDIISLLPGIHSDKVNTLFRRRRKTAVIKLYKYFWQAFKVIIILYLKKSDSTHWEVNI
jgi:hypothetical protein